MSIAFALRAEHADTYAGAVVAAGPNGESMNTAERLEQGNGVIVVDDSETHAITALDEHPHFERVAVPKKAAPVDDEYEGLPVTRLRELAEERGLSKSGGKVDLLAAIRANDAQPTPEPAEGEDSAA